MFIYKITNTTNNKVYIGQTIRQVECRFNRHMNDAKNYILDTHFARAIRKYGLDSFVYEVIDTAKNQEELNLKEQYYIQKYDSVACGYNETDALNKCGGNTYQSKNKEDMDAIRGKIRISKLGKNNPNHTPIKVRNEDTGEELFFDTVSECQKFFNEKTHRFVTTRICGITRSLYKGFWNIARADEDYRELTRGIVRRHCNIEVTDKLTGEVLEFFSVRKMSSTLKIPRIGHNKETERYIIKFR